MKPQSGTSTARSFFTALGARGVLCLLGGLWLFYQALDPLSTAAALLAAVLAADGAVTLWAGYRNFLKEYDWWPLLAQGVSSLLFALVILLWPQLEEQILGLLMACWALWQGLSALFLYRHRMAPRWYGALGVALSIVSGAMMWFWTRLEMAEAIPVLLAGFGLATFVGGIQGQRSLLT